MLYQLSYVGLVVQFSGGTNGPTCPLKGFTEPVALSSPASADLPSSGPKAFYVLVLRSGFDLLALRTRCEGEGTRSRP